MKNTARKTTRERERERFGADFDKTGVKILVLETIELLSIHDLSLGPVSSSSLSSIVQPYGAIFPIVERKLY